jgi:hypothetical protein
MTRTVTTAAVKRILTKGLTGWEAGKLILQDMIDSFLRRDSVLTEADVTDIEQTPMRGADVGDYNMFMALCRGFYKGCIIAGLACKDACLQIGFIDRALQDVEKRRTVELFESCGPRVVTRRQYEEIVAAQREGKLAFEYGLGYVIEQRFYAIAPPEAKAAVDESGVDAESVADFVAAVPEQYTDLCKRAIDEVHGLHASGKLPVVYREEDANVVKPLLEGWKRSGLSAEDTIKLADMLYVAGQTLYDCAGLPEWKGFVDQYQPHWLAGEDERFGNVYAVLDDCPAVWLDKKGRYKGPSRPSEWITQATELFLGLIDHHGKRGKPIERVGAELKETLDAIEQNIRVFLAVKAVLDIAADAVEMDVPDDAGILAGTNVRLDAFIQLYNLRLEELKEERRPWQSAETRLEKALKTLPAIEVDRLKPSPDSLKQLKSKILNDARGEDWLRAKAESLVCADGVNFQDLME